ncbi:MAG: sulfurtransferase TusA family protein [Pseudomonadota bacterium]
MSHDVTKILDLKGLPCPMPVVKMAAEIKTVKVGEIIEVHTTDPGSLSDFPAWAKTTGNQVLESVQGNPIKIYVKRLK